MKNDRKKQVISLLAVLVVGWLVGAATTILLIPPRLITYTSPDSMYVVTFDQHGPDQELMICVGPSNDDFLASTVVARVPPAEIPRVRWEEPATLKIYMKEGEGCTSGKAWDVYVQCVEP